MIGSPMISSSPTRILRPVDDSDGPAPPFVGLSAIAECTRARLGDDLLRCLPTDRDSSAEPTPLAVATLKVAGPRMDHLARISASQRADCEAVFMCAFAMLLARLSGQEVVRLRNIQGDPNILTFKFSPEESFRSQLTAILSQNPLQDQPCAVEYGVGAGEFLPADLPCDALRMAVQVLDCHGQAESQIRLISSSGLWRQPILRLWLRYFDCLLAAVASAPDAPWETLSLLDPTEAQKFYETFNHTAKASPDNLCVHELVMRQVERTPDAIGCCFGIAILNLSTAP